MLDKIDNVIYYYKMHYDRLLSNLIAFLLIFQYFLKKLKTKKHQENNDNLSILQKDGQVANF